MASTAVVALISLCIFSTVHLSFSEVEDVHDLLPLFDLPKGLLPRDIKSYSLSPADRSFIIELICNPCYVKFKDQLVYYDKIIKGKLGFGKVSEVSGIQAKKLFVWVSVSGIEVDKKNGMIEFQVGVLSQKLPAKDFEVIPSCKTKGLQKSFPFVEDALI